jgi:hypothetical protein
VLKWRVKTGQWIKKKMKFSPRSFLEMAKLDTKAISAVIKEFEDKVFPKPKSEHKFSKNYRLLIRILTEAQLMGVAALSRLVDQDYLGGNAMVALLASVGRTSPDALFSGDFPDVRPIAIRGLARSFNRPYETMRRALRRLAELGWIELRDDGVTLHPKAIRDPRIHAYLLEMHDVMATLIDDIYGFAHMPPPAIPTGTPAGTPDPGMMAMAALDLHLLSAEGMQSVVVDWIDLLLMAAISAGNIRDVTYHPELAFRYAGADQIPPMDLRRPVTLAALCEALPVSFTTAWRRVTMMKLTGLVVSVDGGLVLQSRWYGHATMIANGCERIERMFAILHRLAASGVPLGEPGRLFHHGRVPPIAL